MLDASVLVWTPQWGDGIFGFGGYVKNAPICHCGGKMSHVGIFPFGRWAAQFFYCFDCMPMEGQASQSPCLVKIKPLRFASRWRAKISQEDEFVSYEATQGTMSPSPKRNRNEYKCGEGVYTGGLSPIHAPTCPDCQNTMSVLLHIDSYAHESLFWEGMGSIVFFLCPLHEQNVFFKIYEEASLQDV